MTKICPKCKRTIAYDPYFERYVCRQCGYAIVVSTRSVKRAIPEKIKLQRLTAMQ